MNRNRTLRLVLLGALVIFALACRTVDTIALLRSTATPLPRPTRTATRRITRAAENNPAANGTATAIVAVTDTPAPATAAAPAAAPRTQAPTRVPTRAATPRPTSLPAKTLPPPSPTSPYIYKIQESRCGPNVRTYIEGYVYEGYTPKNGVLIRISQGPDGQPDPNDDYLTGSDPRKGYFFQNIDANAPHGGTWYLWVMDPNTKQRISDIEIVKTDPQRIEDTENNPGSCQSATVTFSTSGPRPSLRTATPSATRDPNASPTPTPTQDILNDSGN